MISHFRPLVTLIIAAGLLGWCLPAQAESNAQWIWLGEPQADSTICLRKTFEVTGKVKLARAAVSVDDASRFFINGQQAGKTSSWKEFSGVDITSKVVPGKNVIAIEAQNVAGIGGALAIVKIEYESGDSVETVTDTTWLAVEKPKKGWHQLDFDDQEWQAVKSMGTVGAKGLAWSGDINDAAIKTAFQSGDFGSELPKIAEQIKVPEGFVAERVFSVPRVMGSWVSLTMDSNGRLIASDQQAAGLFLITPGQDGQETTVQKLPIKLSGFQGLCWAFDSLYGVINGGKENGLYRMRDTDGDGLVDSSEYLMKIDGSGEHGPHAVIPSPDGKSLFICAGNHTKLPDDITGSQIPRNWGEDHVLPRRWDANGHAAGILAPGGWIMKIDPDAKTRDVFSIGFRNEYDIAFNSDGELFSYDADMEWDFGSPWYRPTRVCHVTSGSEFGWRSGTGKWPAYYEDSLPGIVDIGPGSPVGIAFGYGAKFPAKYQKALFILDWTYSTIYAIHLTPHDSSYKAVSEEFAVGQPMQVTDAVVGADGALYYTAGGRGTQSALYRIRYTGSEPTAPVDTKNVAGEVNRATRHRLEAMQGHEGGDLDAIIDNLNSDDRFLRYAARIALEAQPVETWREQALHNDKTLNPLGRIDMMIALARQGKPEDLAPVLTMLNSLDYASLDEFSRLAMLRAYELAFTRLGTPNEQSRLKVIEKLNPLYPAKTYPENAELSQILVLLNAPGVVAKTLKIMKELGPEPVPEWSHLINRSSYGGTVGKMLADMPPTRAIHFAFVLRNQKEAWTLPEREEYFQFFIDAAKHAGGNSFSRFLAQMRDDAILTCTPAEKVSLDKLISASLVSAPPTVDPPKGPGRKWTTAEAVAEIGTLKKRNYEKGRQLYFAVSCGKCHRLDAEGGSVGPDLSTAGKKFQLADFLDSIIEPSKVISDQYASQQVLTTDGQVLQGRAFTIGDQLHVYTPDADAPPKVIAMKDVEEILPSKISQMPTGLIDTLNPEELKDLMAYLISGGDKRAEVYK